MDDWKTQLEEKIESVIAEWGFPNPVTPRTKEIKIVVGGVDRENDPSIKGYINDNPFCGARTSTLTVRDISRKDDAATLTFVLCDRSWMEVTNGVAVSADFAKLIG